MVSLYALGKAVAAGRGRDNPLEAAESLLEDVGALESTVEDTPVHTLLADAQEGQVVLPEVQVDSGVPAETHKEEAHPEESVPVESVDD